MIDDIKKKNKKSMIAFMLVLSLFLVFANIFVVLEFRGDITSAQEHHEQHEADLFSEFVSSLVIQRDFAKISDLVEDWGESRENFSGISIVASNGFIVAEYESGRKNIIPSAISKEINVGRGTKYNLNLIYDRTSLAEELNELTIKLVIVSIFMFVCLGITLWWVLLKTAIKPLEKEVVLHKKTSDELLVAKKEADRANRSKSEFLANMSHEIRTPMNGILGMLHLVKNTALSQEQKECIVTADSSAKTLLVILNDILDYSKIEAGKLELEKADFDIHEIISNIGSLFSENAFKKGLELAVDIDDNVPVFVQGDPTRLGQIVSNLVGNAIKFTAKGEVLINVRLKNKNKGKINLCFEIKDTGIGLSEDAIDKIFDDFSQADSTTTRNFGGTGLGLSISKQLAELMGGEIGVTSILGEGSTFRFTIVVDESSLEGNKKENVGFGDKSILVVDDNVTNTQILDKQLSSWSIKHAVCHSGAEAIKMIDEAQAAEKDFDCVLLDMMMPEMDGLEVAKILNKKQQPPKIIMLSSGGTEAVNDALEKNIINTYLLKPVRSSILYNSISAEFVNKVKKVDKKKDYENYSDKTILVTEDNLINQKVIVGILKQFSVTPDIANNGIESLEKIASKKYDLVFMDCQMPEMDGYAATAELRKSEKGDEHLTIVAMTANVMQGDKEKCFAAGMDDYVGKPIKPEVLSECLKRWLKN